jgi:DNA-binding NarL/FixJ family response regulator
VSEGLSALLAGAKGYCARAIDPVSLDKAVASVRDGELWMRRALVNALLAELVARTGDASNDLDKRPDRSCLERLTRRQREVAEAVAVGASNKEIARRLNVTERTVKAHLTEMFRNVGVRDRLRLALLLNEASGAPRQLSAAQSASRRRAPGAAPGNRRVRWPAGVA